MRPEEGKEINNITQILQIRSDQSCPTLCDPMNRSPPGLPVHHQLPEFTQTHVHRVSDAIHPVSVLAERLSLKLLVKHAGRSGEGVPLLMQG